jgi:alkanesulfonate monooxygenase SsuD/methylene tetrahydromethanopterin reductase-like flavin-dependent oxidoreductase (luciferase family)
MSAPFVFSAWSDARPALGDTDYARRYAELLEEAKLADELGFHSFWTSEIHGVDDGYLGAQLPLLAGIATVTKRIRLMTGVLVLPFYQWRQVLEAAVVVDLLSQGRLDLGVSVGAYEREFALFGANMRRRGRLLDEGIRFLRQGLDEGELPDGPDGAPIPLTPRPAQQRLPIYVGGMSPPAVARAVRLGDGTVAYDFEQPEQGLPAFYDGVLVPALEAGSRTLEAFRFTASAALWVSDDPERDWNEVYGPAFAYQQQRYAEWYEPTASGRQPADAANAPLPSMEDHFVGTPEDVARRLVETHRRAPWHELGFFHGLPGVPHERALEQLELVQRRLVPEIERLTGAAAAA